MRSEEDVKRIVHVRRTLTLVNRFVSLCWCDLAADLQHADGEKIDRIAAAADRTPFAVDPVL
jgi:hypothetical protein